MASKARASDKAAVERQPPVQQKPPVERPPLPVPQLNPELLRRPVRQALASPAAEVLEWRCERLHGGFGNSSGGPYRVTGVASGVGAGVGAGGGIVRSWSLVLKELHRPENAQTGEEGRDEYFWKREAMLYASGLLAGLEEGLVVPRCYGVEERPDGTVWMWLEHCIEALDGAPAGTTAPATALDAESRVAGTAGGSTGRPAGAAAAGGALAPGASAAPRWTMVEYATAARHLGAFNGTYLAGRPLPAYPWLSRNWLRQWAERRYDNESGQALRRPRTWRDPAVRRALPPATVARIRRLLDAQAPLLDVLDQLPQTFCHLDAFRRNLFIVPGAGGTPRTVAIDWQFAGHGPVGADAGQLLTASLLFFEADHREAAALDGVVFAGYLRGLADAGYTADPLVVRLGYCASAAVRWALMLPGVFLRMLMDAEYRAGMVRFLGRPADELMAVLRSLLDFMLDLVDEAVALAPTPAPRLPRAR